MKGPLAAFIKAFLKHRELIVARARDPVLTTSVGGFTRFFCRNDMRLMIASVNTALGKVNK